MSASEGDCPTGDPTATVVIDRRAIEELNVIWQFTLLKSNPRNQPRDAARYALAIRHLVPLLDKLGFSQSVILEWLELAVALTELERGTVRRFLMPKSAKSKIAAGDVWQAR